MRASKIFYCQTNQTNNLKTYQDWDLKYPVKRENQLKPKKVEKRLEWKEKNMNNTA